MTEKDSTAILFFSRTAVEEAASKTFNASVGVKGNRAISQCLITDVLTTLEASGLPVVSHFSTEQRGVDFGERLANAVESVYLQGYEKVIIVGNDCPFLSVPLLQQVNTQLNQQQLVLGPATDGGVYLIGIEKGFYQREDFLGLDWQEIGLQASWQQYAKNQSITIDWLEEHFDIDGAADFKLLLSVLPSSHSLRKQLLKILQPFPKSFSFRLLHFQQKERIQKYFLRGPPASLLFTSFG